MNKRRGTSEFRGQLFETLWPERAKGHHAAWLSPAAINPAVTVGQFLQNLPTHGNIQTELPSWKVLIHHLTQRSFEGDPGLIRLLCFQVWYRGHLHHEGREGGTLPPSTVLLVGAQLRSDKLWVVNYRTSELETSCLKWWISEFPC